MKPFVFTLESVRTLRQRKERACMEGYALALGERQRAAQRVEQLARQLMEIWMRIQGDLAEGVGAASLTQLRGFCQDLEESQQQAKRHLDETDRSVQEKLGQMLQARQEREAVDKFCDSQKFVYDRELNREEQKMLDELASRRRVFTAREPRQKVTHD